MPEKKFPVIILLLAGVLLLAGCVQKAQESHYCSDGTLNNSCSDTKPYFCEKGELKQNFDICGCGKEERLSDGACVSTTDCKDGTKNLECSEKKPYQCIKGSLVEKASICGCPLTKEPNADNCIQAKKDSQTREFNYILQGQKSKIEFPVYSDLKQYLAKLPRAYPCNPICPTQEEIEFLMLDNNQQKPELVRLTNAIRSRTTNKDDQARIAISIVQNIPYDLNSFYSGNTFVRYPYEVLYDNMGICAGKSRLLAFLLRELGFGVAYFEYKAENHKAVGIKCPIEYSLDNTGYCFVETTNPSIITDSNGNYFQTGQLKSKPQLIIISDGESFNSTKEEFTDSKKMQELEKIASNNNEQLKPKEYNEWLGLAKKYGLETN